MVAQNFPRISIALGVLIGVAPYVNAVLAFFVAAVLNAAYVIIIIATININII